MTPPALELFSGFTPLQVLDLSFNNNKPAEALAITVYRGIGEQEPTSLPFLHHPDDLVEQKLGGRIGVDEITRPHQDAPSDIKGLINQKLVDASKKANVQHIDFALSAIREVSDDADFVAGMAGGAGIDRRLTRDAGLAEVSVDRDMWPHRSFSQVVHELRDIISLVRAERDPPTSAIATINQRRRRLSFGGPGRLADDAADHQTMAFSIRACPM
jgi:hypothetical protein